MTLSPTAHPRAILTLKTNVGEEMSIVMEHVSAKAAGAALDFPSEILAQLRQHGLVAGDDKQIDLDDAARVVEDLRAAMRPFVGVPILISEAAEKYGFSVQSIQNWVRSGWVRVLIPEPRRRVDESDIVLAQAIAKMQGHIAGRAVFPAKPRSGRPRKAQS